jgi:DME family drug/metabolite transporter
VTDGRRVTGYLFALGAGTLWGTTGPLSTALYAAGVPLTGIGFWRILLGALGLIAYGAVRNRDLFRADRRGWLVVGLGGGALVALFEVAYQFGIAGAGVAGASALLYTAPVMVAFLSWPLLGERLTPFRLLLAITVMAGAALTVTGGETGFGDVALPSVVQGVAGGLVAAAAYAGTTVMARWAVPRYGVIKVLFLEIVGGVAILGLLLPLLGHPPGVPSGAAAWLFTIGLTLGTVWLANILYFGALRRIEATPTNVAATIEPVVGTLLAFFFLGQALSLLGWVGLVMVVAGVAAGYVREKERA